MNAYGEILGRVTIPRMYRITREFDRRRIDDVPGAISAELSGLPCVREVNGKRVALAVGSRGLANLPLIVRSVIAELRRYGAKEIFIVPAMGSHAGAVAENQKAMLRHLGVSEESMGIPVCASMETVVLGYTDDGMPVHFDRLASEADYTVSIGRVKPHCSFQGKYESGMLKMSVIGLGKQRGADVCHEHGMANMSRNIEKIGRISLEKSNLLFCLGLMENAYDETCRIFAVPAGEIMEREPDLLLEAKELLPQIPFENLDLLIVREMGKNITGTGMDCNIIRRFTSEHLRMIEPVSKRLAVLSLTPESDGNAAGIGLADVTTRSVFEAMSMEKTYPNFLTSRTPNGCRIPMVMDSDEMAIRAALKMLVSDTADDPRIVFIQNTLEMSQMMISESLLAEARLRADIRVDEPGEALAFDRDGRLCTEIRKGAIA